VTKKWRSEEDRETMTIHYHANRFFYVNVTYTFNSRGVEILDMPALLNFVILSKNIQLIKMMVLG
jgi:hypothetical protein